MRNTTNNGNPKGNPPLLERRSGTIVTPTTKPCPGPPPGQPSGK